MRIYIFFFLLSFNGLIFAQDTLSILQYNLLNYGNNSGSCNATTNNITTKETNLKTIIKHVNPDVFGVNEMGVFISSGDNIYAGRLLQNVLNTDGVTKYARFDHTGTSNLCNMLYYNSEKLEKYKQDFFRQDLNGDNMVREIDFYTLYYKDANLAVHQDTIFLMFVVMHLKAGNSSSNQNERLLASEAVMSYINANQKVKNRFLMGDLNVYTDQELAFQQFVNYSVSSIKFVDPINEMGDWNNNYDYRHVHTQSTRSENLNDGCFVGGGSDDRFDFILVSNEVMNNSVGVKYIPDSYNAVGQDGSFYNGELTYVGNTAVPDAVALAMYEASDHLPVNLKVKIHQGPLSVENYEMKELFDVRLNNPFDDQLSLYIKNNQTSSTTLTIELRSITGQLLISKSGYHIQNEQTVEIYTEHITSGFYLLSIKDESEKTMLVKKLVKY
jgi:hypothetical protein